MSDSADHPVSARDTVAPAAVTTGGSSSTPRRYRAFISYSHADTQWANWLMRRLEGYRVSARFHGRTAPIGVVERRIAPVFRDRDELPTTSDLGETIRTALQQSATLIVICSPRSARSRWVQEEILAFKRMHGERRVFAFIVAGEPKFPGADEDCFSPALRTEVGADGALSGAPAEVVAADARPHGDGPKLAFVRLVAGLLGVGFDELRQRELLRRNRRLTFLAIGSAAGMAITLGLAAAAWRARNEAVLAQNDARRRQDQAERVLAFMLGDFRDELKKFGRLDLLDRVGDTAMGYFESLDARDLTDTALARHAKALTQIGEVRVLQKNVRYAEAGRAFFAAYERAAALVARHPRNGDMIFERAQAEYWIGFVHWRRGRYAAAGEWLGRYRDSGAELAALDPKSLAWRRELIAGHHNLAVLDLSRGQLAAAEAGFGAALAMNEQALAANPKDLQLKYRVADTISWLGNTADQSGRLAEALARFRAQGRLLEELVQSEPSSARWKARLSEAYGMEAQALGILGRRAEAQAVRRRGRELLDPLVRADPANRAWLRAALNHRMGEGFVRQAENDPGVLHLVAEVRSDAEKLLAGEPSDRALARELALALRFEAELLADVDLRAASVAITRALVINEAALAEPEVNDRILSDYVKCAWTAGVIAGRGGDRAAALRHWERAHVAMATQLPHSSHWRLLDPAARLLVSLGKTDAARALVARLDRCGYQPLLPWPKAVRP